MRPSCSMRPGSCSDPSSRRMRSPVSGGMGWAALFAISIACSSMAGADLLSDFQPAGVESSYGAVRRVQFSTGLVDLGPHVLVHSPPGSMRDFRFPEPVWVIGYRSAIFGPDAQPADNTYICHTFFGEQRVVQRQH